MGRKANGEGSVDRLPSGNWRARTYMDGKQVSHGSFATRELAEAATRNFKVRHGVGTDRLRALAKELVALADAIDAEVA